MFTLFFQFDKDYGTTFCSVDGPLGPEDWLNQNLVECLTKFNFMVEDYATQPR
jgi:hypothetical protein